MRNLFLPVIHVRYLQYIQSALNRCPNWISPRPILKELRIWAAEHSESNRNGDAINLCNYSVQRCCVRGRLAASSTLWSDIALGLIHCRHPTKTSTCVNSHAVWSGLCLTLMTEQRSGKNGADENKKRSNNFWTACSLQRLGAFKAWSYSITCAGAVKSRSGLRTAPFCFSAFDILIKHDEYCCRNRIGPRAISSWFARPRRP